MQPLKLVYYIIRKFMCATFGHKRSKNFTYEHRVLSTGALIKREHFCFRCGEWV